MLMVGLLLVGNPVPLQVMVEPESAQPAIFRLAALIGMLFACRSAIAFGILPAQSPETRPEVQLGVAGAGIATIDGLVTPPNWLPTSYRCPSYDPKKKALSLMIGPPTDPPNCSRVRGFFGLGNCLKAHGLLAQLKKLRASIAPSRPKANAVP